MHRIDSSTATPDNRFTEGNPTIPVPATTVTADWLNSVQEEAIAVLAAAGIAPDKANNAQVLSAIRKLIADKTLIDGVTIRRWADGTLYAPSFLLGEFYYFRHPTLRTGFAPCQGGILANAVAQYPEIWAYLQTTEGQLLCKTEAQWQAMTTATWATLADGSKVGWGGIGGAPYYVQDLSAGTLRMPDLRGMYAEAAGFDSLGVGGVHGDMIRNIYGRYYDYVYQGGAGYTSGAITTPPSPYPTRATMPNGVDAQWLYVDINAASVVPTGAANKPRGWGALACAYLGHPTS